MRTLTKRPKIMTSVAAALKKMKKASKKESEAKGPATERKTSSTKTNPKKAK
jgi:hypothetical protein